MFTYSPRYVMFYKKKFLIFFTTSNRGKDLYFFHFNHGLSQKLLINVKYCPISAWPKPKYPQISLIPQLDVNDDENQKMKSDSKNLTRYFEFQ